MTLREHLEAIRDRHQTVINGIGVECGCREGCEGTFPCADNSDAVAALAILDEADYENRPKRYQAHQPGGDWVAVPNLVCLVPDPERPAATPTTTEASE